MELTKQETAQLEGMLKKVGESTAANAKKVLLRMNAASDEGLLRMVIKAFITFHLEYKQNQELEEATKKKEKQMEEYMKGKAEGQRKVIQRMVTAMGSGLVQSCFKEWAKHTAEEKAGERMQEMLDERMGKLGLFAGKNKGAAMKAASRLAQLMDDGALLVTITGWKKIAKVDRVARYARAKNHEKRKKLVGVRDDFNGFANELDGVLKAGTPRTEVPKG